MLLRTTTNVFMDQWTLKKTALLSQRISCGPVARHVGMMLVVCRTSTKRQFPENDVVFKATDPMELSTETLAGK